VSEYGYIDLIGINYLIFCFQLPVWAHGTIELLALTVIGVELHLKLKWIGWSTILKHKRTMIKVLLINFQLFEFEELDGPAVIFGVRSESKSDRKLSSVGRSLDG
jgi:hypothetical protein